MGRIQDGLGSIIRTFTTESDLEAFTRDDYPIKRFTPVASYTWIKASQPTIAVPGCPEMYGGFEAPLRISRDTGTEIVDRATYLLPRAPFLPMIQAVRCEHPEYDFAKHEVITKRGELKKLLSWAMGEGKEFRVDAEMTDFGALVLRRWEPSLVAEAGYSSSGARVPHYRTNFERETCHPVQGVEHGQGHARIVSYELCGLSILVEFKVDSFRTEDEDIIPGPAERKLSNVDVENPETPENEDRSSKMLRVLAQHGHQIPHEFLVDLRTRSTRSFHALGPTDVYNHAIWSRTPTTIVALHTFGTFEKEEVFKFEDLEERVEAEAVQDGVRKVGYLLKEIISTLKNKPVGSKYSLVCMAPVGRKLALREGGRGAGVMVDSTA